jgi:hypothetical protein
VARLEFSLSGLNLGHPLPNFSLHLVDRLESTAEIYLSGALGFDFGRPVESEEFSAALPGFHDKLEKSRISDLLSGFRILRRFPRKLSFELHPVQELPFELYGFVDRPAMLLSPFLQGELAIQANQRFRTYPRSPARLSAM